MCLSADMCVCTVHVCLCMNARRSLYLELLYSLQRVDGNNLINFPELAVKPHYQPLCRRESREKAHRPPQGEGAGRGGKKEQDRVKTLFQVKFQFIIKGDVRKKKKNGKQKLTCRDTN